MYHSILEALNSFPLYIHLSSEWNDYRYSLLYHWIIVIKLVEWLHLLWGYIQESCLTWKNNSTSRKCCTILLAACRCQSRTLCCALLSNKINSQSHTLTHAAHPGLRREQAVWLYPVDEMHVSPLPSEVCHQVVLTDLVEWFGWVDKSVTTPVYYFKC